MRNGPERSSSLIKKCNDARRIRGVSYSVMPLYAGNDRDREARISEDQNHRNLLQASGADRDDSIRVSGTRKADELRGYYERLAPAVETEGRSNRKSLLRRRNAAGASAQIRFLRSDLLASSHEHREHSPYGNKLDLRIHECLTLDKLNK